MGQPCVVCGKEGWLLEDGHWLCSLHKRQAEAFMYKDPHVLECDAKIINLLQQKEDSLKKAFNTWVSAWKGKML